MALEREQHWSFCWWVPDDQTVRNLGYENREAGKLRGCKACRA